MGAGSRGAGGILAECNFTVFDFTAAGGSTLLVFCRLDFFGQVVAESMRQSREEKAIPPTESQGSTLVSSLPRQRPLIETFAVVQASFQSEGAGRRVNLAESRRASCSSGKPAAAAGKGRVH